MSNAGALTYRLGLVGVVVGVAAIHIRLVAPEPGDLLRPGRLVWWAVVAVVLVATGYGLGLPELATTRQDAAGRGLAATLAAIGVVSVAQLVVAAPLLPRLSLGLLVVIVPLWSVLGWNVARDVTGWRTDRDRIVLVSGRPGEHAALTVDLDRHPERPASLVGALTVADARSSLDELVEATGATVVVLDTAAQSDDGVVERVAALHGRGVRVRTLALFYEEWLGKLPLAELARVSLFFDIGELHRIRYGRAKRVLDVALSIAALPVLGGAAAAIGVGNLVANRGPLLYSQPRVGKDGTPFTIHKFRTMVPVTATGSETSSATPWTAVGDDRITALGGFLRRTHLDELPQVVNVLRGELSMIGPRPEQPHYVEELRDKVPFYDVRHLVRPGLTGWAQVKHGYGSHEADALEKLQYDVYYLRRQGLALDVRILWRTIRGVIGAGGR